MARVFRSLLNLYPGEGKRTFLFFLLALFWSFGSYGFQTLSEGLFIRHMGASALPLSYLLTAFAMMALAGWFLYAFSRWTSSLLFRLILASSVALELTLAFLLLRGAPTSGLCYLLRVVSWTIPIAINISFWVFSDRYFNFSAAKRCFCLLNSAIFLGDALAGGLITFFLAALKPFGLQLFFVAALILGALLFMVIERYQKEEPALAIGKKEAAHTRFMKTAKSSPFALLLMLFYFVMQLLLTMAEYSYMETFDLAFSKAPDQDLTAFLGKMAMIVSFINMIFGIFFYSRTVSRFGVNNAILVAPLFFLLLFLFGVRSEAAFGLALAAFVAREGLSYTFDDNNYLILLSGVPFSIKNQVRATIESFLRPLSMLFAATLLFIMEHKVAAIAIVVALVALLLALRLRALYPKALLKNLFSMAHSDRAETDWVYTLSRKEKLGVERSLLLHLKQGDEKIRLFALESLLNMKNPRLLPFLVSATPELSPRGKRQAFELFENSPWAAEPIVAGALDRWRRSHLSLPAHN